MFLYVLTLLLVLNAFTQDVMAQPCADRVPGPVCQQMKDKGNCNNPVFETIARMQCAKTCGFCDLRILGQLARYQNNFKKKTQQQSCFADNRYFGSSSRSKIIFLDILLGIITWVAIF